MTIGRERYVYKAMVEGEAPDPPEALMRRIRQVDNWRSHLETAVELVIEAANESANVRGHDAENAFMFVASVTETPKTSRAFCRVALYLAKQDPRYWGVNDPDAERYCSVCREVHDIERFPDGEYKCRESQAEEENDDA